MLLLQIQERVDQDLKVVACAETLQYLCKVGHPGTGAK